MSSNGSASEDWKDLLQALKTIGERIAAFLFLVLVILFIFHWISVSFRHDNPTPWYSTSLWDSAFMVKDDLDVFVTCPTKYWNWFAFLLRTERNTETFGTHSKGIVVVIDLRRENASEQVCALTYD